MQFEDHPAPPPPTPRGPSRRTAWLAAAAVALLVVVVVVTAVVNRSDEVTRSPAPDPLSPRATAAPTTTINTQTEVVARLQEILRIREEAFANRDPSLFDQIYSNDCPCLRAGRNAVAALVKENVVWKGRSVSVLVQSTQSINDRLWEVIALFTSKPFRIETEQGVLIRRAPAERLKYRFLLFRPARGDPWLLGNASVLKDA